MNAEKYKEVYKAKKDILIDNFLGGISWGLGATIGLALILTVLTFVLKQLDLVPFIGNFATQITTYVQTHSTQPKK